MPPVSSPPRYYTGRLRLICVLLLGVASVVYLVFITLTPHPTEAASVLPLQSAPPTVSVAKSHEEAALPQPTVASANPTEQPKPALPVISASAIEQLYIPADTPDHVINSPVLAMPSSCQTVIEPPLSGPTTGSVFQCMDFAMPSTATDTNTVLAGHSSFDLTTVFNRLYVQGESLVGRQVFVRTKESRDRWLSYQVENVYQPAKDQLPYMWQVWAPTPGRLILVTCMQEGNGLSTKNFVVVAQFTGVQSP